MANFYGGDASEFAIGGAFINYYGGNGNDFLNGNANANEVYGGQGSDVLAGAFLQRSRATGAASNPFVLTLSRLPEMTISRAAPGRTPFMGPTAMTRSTAATVTTPAWSELYRGSRTLGSSRRPLWRGRERLHRWW